MGVDENDEYIDDELDGKYDESIYQEYFEWAAEFSEGIVASGESGSGWFYTDPVKELNGEPFYSEMDDPFYDPWENDYGDGVLETEHPLDVAYEREQRKLAKHFHALWLKEEKEKCDWERLKGYGLPLCGSHKAIAKLMEISVKKLRFLAFSRKKSPYIRFQIPKKIGGKRDISSPILQLKQAQEWILENILEKLEPHNAAHGFRCGRSIVTNAQPHVGAEAIVNVDLQDFFPSIGLVFDF